MITALKNSFAGLVRPGQHVENRKLHGGWMFLLIFLLSVITAALFVQPMNRLKNDKSFDEALSQIPEFTYANGELIMEQQYMLPLTTRNDRNMLFCLDTSVDTNSLSQDTLAQVADTYNCSQVMALVRDGMIVMEAGRANAVPYTTFFGRGTTLNNANLKQAIVDFIKVISIICAVILSVFYIGVFYFSLLIYTIIGLIINAVLNANYSFGDLYRTVFSAALPLWLFKAVLCMFVSGGTESLVKWLIRFVIILYFFFALYLKKKEEEQLAVQTAAMNNSRDEMNINNFVSSYELDDDLK